MRKVRTHSRQLHRRKGRLIKGSTVREHFRKTIIRRNPRNKLFTVMVRNPKRLKQFGEYRIVGAKPTHEEAEELARYWEGKK